MGVGGFLSNASNGEWHMKFWSPAPEHTSCCAAGSQPTMDCYWLVGAGEPSPRAYDPQQEKPTQLEKAGVPQWRPSRAKVF